MSPSSARPSQTPRRRRCSSQPSRARRPGRASACRAPARRGSGVPSPSSDQCTARPSIALDPDRAAQAIDRQALDEVVGRRGLAIEQQIVAIVPDDEIEQAFALRREQPGPDRQRARHIARHQPLHEAAHVLAGQANDGAVGEGGRGHGSSVREPRVASQTLTIRRPDDWHVHLRDGEMLKAVAPYTARQFARAIVMPNLAPPITTVEAARDYRERILEAAAPGFTPLMTCYLTDETDPDEIARGLRGRRLGRGQALSGGRDHQQRQRRHRHPQHLSGAGADGEDRHGAVRPRRGDRPGRRRVRPRGGVHRPGPDAASSATFPGLKIVFEHITTADAVDFVEGGGPTSRATVTPQHLIINRNAMFAGGLRPHAYCLPVAKREEHRLAVRKAAISGSPKFFLGTDSAPHARDAKEIACGCAGIFNAPFALESYADRVRGRGRARPARGVRVGTTARASTACRSTRGRSRSSVPRSKCRRRSTAWCRSTPARRCAGACLPEERGRRILRRLWKGKSDAAHSFCLLALASPDGNDNGDGRLAFI